MFSVTTVSTRPRIIREGMSVLEPIAGRFERPTDLSARIQELGIVFSYSRSYPRQLGVN